MTQTIDAARLLAVFEQIATNPKTLALVERAAAGVAKAPVSPKLAGVKTYVVAALGGLSTILGVVDAFALHGGLTPAGWFAAILALTGSAGLATMRSALTGHAAEILGTILDMGQSIAMEAQQSQGVTGTAQVVVAAAPEIAAAAITAAPAAVVGAATEVVGDVAGGLVGGLAGILGTATGQAGVAPPVQPQPKAP